ncbi:MAG: xanthine dehydrogenase family protein molybdopterin-binding subunit, partial [Alphaproteobacteria bacterium]
MGAIRRAARITRRVFLLGTVAVAGGAAFGIYKLRQEPPNPLVPRPGETPLNAFVVVTRDGVRVVTGRAEMGQGTHTTMAALVAEELDVPWEQVEVIHGPAAQAYYNSALLGAGLPWPDYRITGWREWLREQAGEIGKLMKLQVTGGSTAMIDAFERLRIAGASAREMLKAAAAERLGVPAERLRTEGGRVIAPDGTALPYAELAEAAARQEPPAEVKLRERSRWRYLGRPMPRLDVPAKVTGRATFGLDVRLPGMRFAAVRMNPRLGGPMRRFDAAAAEAMPGVEKVIDLGTGIAVVARNSWLAMRAAEAVEIEWGPAPYPASDAELTARIEAAFEGEPDSALRDDGDALDALAKAPKDRIIEAEYRVPWLAHATMEPMNATGWLHDGVLEIWSPNQAPIVARDKAAEAVGLEPDKVVVHTTFLGGGFGRRAEFDFSVLAARVAAAMPGVPVQVMWSREEDMTHDFYRPAAIGRYRAVLGKDGPEALLGRVAAPSVAHQSSMRIAGFVPPGPDKAHVEGAFDQPYAI